MNNENYRLARTITNNLRVEPCRLAELELRSIHQN